MRAISLWQPWASLWLSERKVHETRHWPTSHRGPLLVHAAQKIVKDIDQGDPLREILDDEFGGHWAMDLPRGALLGIVEIEDCIPTEKIWEGWGGAENPDLALAGDDYVCGNFEPGRFGWRRGAWHRFAAPIPYRGAQGLFTVPDGLVP